MADSLAHLARKVLTLSGRDWADLAWAQWELLVARGMVRNRPLGSLATPTSAASAAVPAEKDTSKDVQKVSDPGSPFVWDALGATPSIRLPRKSANHSESAGAQKVEKADKAAPPAGVVEARSQSAQATH